MVLADVDAGETSRLGQDGLIDQVPVALRVRPAGARQRIGDQIAQRQQPKVHAASSRRTRVRSGAVASAIGAARCAQLSALRGRHDEEVAMRMSAKLGAEFMGTYVLVFGGTGAAVLAAKFLDPVGQNTGLGIGFLGVSFAFGLTVLTMAYAVGHISGGHFNPAITIG